MGGRPLRLQGRAVSGAGVPFAEPNDASVPSPAHAVREIALADTKLHDLLPVPRAVEDKAALAVRVVFVDAPDVVKLDQIAELDSVLALALLGPVDQLTEWER